MNLNRRTRPGAGKALFHRQLGEGMEDLFELMTEEGGGAASETKIRIGIRVKVSGLETPCPVTRPCASYDVLEKEVQGIKNGLDLLLTRAEKMFRGSKDRLGLDLHGPAEEIWAALSGMNEKTFIEAFNGLEEFKRRDVAEYVLTHCNVFSGNARIFSARYDEESGLMG
jgi:hypothetical protein